MKYLIIIGCVFITATSFSQQNFSTDVATAKTAYASGKLEDAHFALQQAMQEIDMVIGKQVLSQLPQKLDAFTANASKDEVISNVGFMGSTIHRVWGDSDNVDLSIIGNSPLISTLNTFLNTPLIGGIMSRNGDNKIIKVQGYKGQLTKDQSGTQTNYTIQLPLGSSLITFKANNCTDAQITAWANLLPLPQIAKLLQ